MWRELLLGSTILTNYARAIEAMASPPTYQLGPAARGDFAGDVGQASVGSAGTVSSEGLTRVAGPWQATPGDIAKIGSSCDTTPIILTTPVESAGTWTAIAGCAHVSIQAFGPGQGPGTVGTHPPGGKGGGFGAENGVSVTPGNPYGYWIGGGKNPTIDTFFCNAAPASCVNSSSPNIVAMGTAGVNLAEANVGSTKFDGGAGAANAGNYGGFGGGGGGAGPHGAGGAGAVASYGTGGAGGQGDNGTGGAGGPTVIGVSNGTAGSAGVNVSGRGAGGGGSAAGYNAYNPGGGGAWGGAAAGHSGGATLVGVSAGQGGIILTPAP